MASSAPKETGPGRLSAVKPVLVYVLTRPLGAPQFAAVLATAIVIATFYCQLYCAIAFPTRRGLPMPISASIPWAVASVTPWLCCLELAKRRSAWTRSERVRQLALVSMFVIAAALSIVLEAGLDQLIGVETRPLPRQVAAQLPLAAMTAAVLFLEPGDLRPDKSLVVAADSLNEVLALAPTIQWIEAAGNYVEVHTNRAVSLHRTTMRELEAALDRTAFRRIHRSLIVNLSAVEARVVIGGSPAVRLEDGTVLKVGRRYAFNFA